MNSIFLATVLVLGALVYTSEATIMCYECSGTTCDDPYEKIATHEKTSCEYCTKIKSEIDSSEVQTIVRKCETGGTIPYDECVETTEGGVTSSLCYCDEEGCNGAGHVAVALTSVVGVLLAHWLL